MILFTRVLTSLISILIVTVSFSALADQEGLYKKVNFDFTVSFSALADQEGFYKKVNFDLDLAICQEQYRLSLLNIDAPENISVKANFPAIDCFDSTYNDKRLVATAADSIYQFAASDELLTKLNVRLVGVSEPLVN